MSNAPDWRAAGRVHEWTRGDRLRAAREHSDGSPSQPEFAKRIGFSKNTVARYERDEAEHPKPIVIVQWSRATGFDYDWLMDGEAGPRSPGTGAVTIRYQAIATRRMAA